MVFQGKYLVVVGSISQISKVKKKKRNDLAQGKFVLFFIYFLRISTMNWEGARTL